MIARFLVLLAALGLAGCDLPPLPLRCGQDGAPACACGEARRKPSGGCCPSWTVAEADGRCTARPFSPPAPGDAIGPEGARAASVAVDRDGRAILGWEIATTLIGGVLRAEELAGGAWSVRSPSIAVGSSAGSGYSAYTRVAAGLDGTAVVAWGQAIGPAQSGFIFASFRDAAGRWSDPSGVAGALSRPPTSYQPRPATNAQGEWILVWDQWMSTGYGVAVAGRLPGDAGWKLPADADDVLSPHILYSNAPQIALNDAGAALVVWYQSNGGPLMVYASERTSSGAAFTRPGKDDFLSAPGAPVDSHPIANPAPALASDGRAAVAWTQENAQGAIPVFFASRDRAGQWTKPASLADSFSAPAGIARCAQVAFGPRGDLYVIWYQDLGFGDAVLAARRAPDGTWVESGQHPIQLSSPGATAFAPSLAVGRDGDVIVAWAELQKGVTRIMASRTGTTDEPWKAAQQLSPEGLGDAEDPSVAIGGDGDRALIAWTQGPFLAARVFVARVE